MTHQALFNGLSIGTQASADTIRAYLMPLSLSLAGLALTIATGFIVYGGLLYVFSQGDPMRALHAKRIIRNALVGLVLVVAAGALVAILMNSFSPHPNEASALLPQLHSIQPKTSSNGLVDVIIKAVTGLISDLIDTAAQPFISALVYFVHKTPLVSDNPSVYNLWLVVLSVSDVLFILVIMLIGFRLMSFHALGLDEVNLSQLIPQLVAVFGAMNISLFLVDALIELSNSMIAALQENFSNVMVWNALNAITKNANGYSLAALMVMVAFLVLVVVLLVYYVGRLVTIYLGAILSPLILLLWLMPSFKNFATNAAKSYITTIFVLFVHVVILDLAASLLEGLTLHASAGGPDPIMALVVGIATLLALLKTQGVMSQFSLTMMGVRSLHKLGGQFMASLNYAVGGGQ